MRIIRRFPMIAGMALAATTHAASHSDAPLIKQDPQANITDVYAFIGIKLTATQQKVLNVLVSVRPFSEPGDGVIYERFSDDLLYSIHITNPQTGTTVTRYDFLFTESNPTGSPLLRNPNTIFSYGKGSQIGPIQTVGDQFQNFTQSYSVKRTQLGITTDTGSGITSPPNVGNRVTPKYNDSQTGFAISGALDFAGLDAYTRSGIGAGNNGEVFWAGSRDDGFYADTPGIFDMLDPRILDKDGNLNDGLGQDGGGVDGFKGYNVLSFGVQIPIQNLAPTAYSPALETGTAMGVGVYASVSRQRVTVRRSDGTNVNSGPWIQVNRMGNPLFNELFVALKDKDKYNRSSPTADPNQFQTYALNPEVAGLINTILGTALPTTNRTDLAKVFIPDVLRVNTSTNSVRLPGQAGFSRLSRFGSDFATGGSPANVSGGWPNGRRIGDDVVDIALTAVASGPSYSTITLVGDNVAANDQIYNGVFPYLATPHAGPRNRKDTP